jgi:hypothetical protein
MARNLFGLVHTLLDDSGALEPGGTIEVYDAGTTTPRTVYSDRALSTGAGSTITADAAGRFPERWIADSVEVKLVYKDTAGATLSTRDYYNNNFNSVPATWETSALGAVSGNEQVYHTLQTADANQTRIITRSYRFSNGATHETNALELRRRVDSTDHGHVRFQYDRTAIGFNGVNHWEATSSGHLQPTTDSSYDIGATATRPRVIYGDDLSLRPSASRTPAANGDLEIEATNNTTLTFKFKGSDGTVRSGTVTLS